MNNIPQDASDALMPPEAMARLTEEAVARDRALAADDANLRHGGDRFAHPDPGDTDPSPAPGEVEF
jgi:hypothetical protein